MKSQVLLTSVDECLTDMHVSSRHVIIHVWMMNEAMLQAEECKQEVLLAVPLPHSIVDAGQQDDLVAILSCLHSFFH